MRTRLKRDNRIGLHMVFHCKRKNVGDSSKPTIKKIGKRSDKLRSLVGQNFLEYSRCRIGSAVIPMIPLIECSSLLIGLKPDQSTQNIIVDRWNHALPSRAFLLIKLPRIPVPSSVCLPFCIQIPCKYCKNYSRRT